MKSYEDYLRSGGEYGEVTELRPPIAIIEGLPSVSMEELVVFENGAIGEVMGMNRHNIEVLTFAHELPVVGSRLAKTGSSVTIPLSLSVLGTVISPLGERLYGQETAATEAGESRPLGIDPVNLSQRELITEPLLTGSAVVDLLLPLGRGQRQLVVGDRKTGKSSFLLTVLLQQAREDVVVVYCQIGKQWKEIKRLYSFIEEHGLAAKAVVVASAADQSPSLIAKTPEAALTVAEFFRDLGHHVLVILDDLTTHAKYYRELSLLARRFPGRDSYPGDMFYQHAKLLERAGNFRNPHHGPTSITCLPVAETVEGDLTDYIVSNLISITDGHLLFDKGELDKGRTPPVDIGLSVTRVGKQVQPTIARAISGRITTFLSSYQKILGLSHFGAELNEEVRTTLTAGTQLLALFNQKYTEVVPQETVTVLCTFIWRGWLKELSEADIQHCRQQFSAALEQPEVRALITKILQSDGLESFLKQLEENKEQIQKLCQKVA